MPQWSSQGNVVLSIRSSILVKPYTLHARAEVKDIMCESSAYVIRKGVEEKLLEDVTFIKPEKDRVLLRNLFGKEISLRGRIEEIRFMDHKILLAEED